MDVVEVDVPYVEIFTIVLAAEIIVHVCTLCVDMWSNMLPVHQVTNIPIDDYHSHVSIL